MPKPCSFAKSYFSSQYLVSFSGKITFQEVQLAACEGLHVSSVNLMRFADAVCTYLLGYKFPFKRLSWLYRVVLYIPGQASWDLLVHWALVHGPKFPFKRFAWLYGPVVHPRRISRDLLVVLGPKFPFERFSWLHGAGHASQGESLEIC